MARHLKLEVLNCIREAGLVAVFHHSDPDTAIRIADAVCKGGFRVLEFTNRGDHSIEVFVALERWVREEHPQCVIGVGSIVDAPTASAYINAGTDFVVGPSLSAETAALCNRRQIPYVPGCGTLTEMLTANELGCAVVKAFPAGSLGGPDFVKAVKAPCPWLQIMPTGGVSATVENLQAWFDAGAFAVGMGSKLIPKGHVADQRWDDIEALARQATEIAASVR